MNVFRLCGEKKTVLCVIFFSLVFGLMTYNYHWIARAILFSVGTLQATANKKPTELKKKTPCFFSK